MVQNVRNFAICRGHQGTWSILEIALVIKLLHFPRGAGEAQAFGVFHDEASGIVDVTCARSQK